jgi:hypothetical protein
MPIRYEIKVTELLDPHVGVAGDPKTVLYTQVVDKDPTKMIQQALTAKRSHKRKEKPQQGKLT